MGSVESVLGMTTNRSPRWALWQRLTLVADNGQVYLDRLRILQTPWFGLYLHRMDSPDPGFDLHDHPWWFASLILRGGYIEEHAAAREAPAFALLADRYDTCRRGVERKWPGGSLHSFPLTDCHRIVRLLRVPTWTLVLTGPRRRSWGFYQPEGFVDWRDYDAARRANLEARGERADRQRRRPGRVES